MTCWVVVPVKARGAGKTRLSGMLSEEERHDLVTRMLHHVVGVAGGVAAVDEVLLLGPDRHGLPDSIRLLSDPDLGLNQALSVALRAAAEARVGRLVLIAGDLPLLTDADVAGLLSGDARSIVIAPDRADTGTNALSLPLPAAAGFRFHYGSGSFSRHGAEAASLGLATQPLRSPTLALDIDEPADLEAWAQRRQFRENGGPHRAG